ncbi:MAG: peptidyl-prolyl cis-trans isomerase [Deltaproteobacteria bacterium]|nr:peptidyl-prolyl cis-trans isomerase [Deltaproteobacteria bacterium]
MRSVLREPLLHFVVGAVAIALLQHAVGDEEPPPEVIVVDRAVLLRTVQARQGRYREGEAEATLDAMSDDERQALIDSYVREEALYREALRVGLDEEDYVVRRRLGQSMELMTRGLAGADQPLDEDSLRERFEAEGERWRLAPSRTLRLVFFAPEDRSEAGFAAAMEHARQAVEETEPQGDLFEPGSTFEAVTERTLASQLGPELAAAIFELPAQPDWQGPLRSSFGAHLVQVTEEQAGDLPAFEDVRGRIEAEVRSELDEVTGDAAVDALVDRYEVRVELER